MSHNTHHEHLIKEMSVMFAPLFKKSPQAIYLYLDDEHKICNVRFAKMLGYKNPQEWVDYQYPVSDVAQKDQNKGIKAYMDASRKMIASTLPATWVRKDGKKVNTIVTLVPIPYRNEVFVLHVISKK